MNKIFTLLFLVTGVNLLAQETNFFEQANRFLVTTVQNGGIDYQKLAEDSDELNDLIQDIATHDLSTANKDYKMAFYLNAYNLTVINQVISNYPINSPFDVEGFFKKNRFEIAGEMLTLDQIEFDKLMNPYKDSRVHFALGCAARSCPFLYDNAFTPDHVNEQLEFRAQLIIDRPNYVTLDNESKTVTLNKIFDWYGDQFSYNAGSLINFINRYRFYKVPLDYQVHYYEYDWTLNDLKE